MWLLSKHKTWLDDFYSGDKECFLTKNSNLKHSLTYSCDSRKQGNVRPTSSSWRKLHVFVKLGSLLKSE